MFWFKPNPRKKIKKIKNLILDLLADVKDLDAINKQNARMIASLEKDTATNKDLIEFARHLATHLERSV